jgi:hypothetical protein
MKESGGYKKRRKMGDDEEEVEGCVNSRKSKPSKSRRR